MFNRLTIALPKGRILKDAIKLIGQMGIELPDSFMDSRKLIIDCHEKDIRFILVKPIDIPIYVEQGVADIGIAGKDVLLECSRQVFEVLDLNISPCRIAVAGPYNASTRNSTIKIATKYPNIATKFFQKHGEQVEIIHLNGSIELAPVLGLADRIVDIVSTGQTLKENGLVELKKIANITSRLIVNPTSYYIKTGRVASFVNQSREAARNWRETEWTSENSARSGL